MKRQLTNEQTRAIADRCQNAALAIVHYKEEFGDPIDIAETAITDLLADLMHYCDAFKLNWDEILISSASHYFAELNGEE